MADDKELKKKTTSALCFTGEDCTKWEAWSFKMLVFVAKEGCESAFLSPDLSLAVNPDA